MQVQIHRFPMSICCNKKPRRKSSCKQTEINIFSSINQMVFQLGGKSHRVAFWYLQAVRLKIRDSHFTCKVAKKNLNVCERVKVVERNKRLSPPFLCRPVNRQCL